MATKLVKEPIKPIKPLDPMKPLEPALVKASGVEPGRATSEAEPVLVKAANKIAEPILVKAKVHQAAEPVKEPKKKVFVVQGRNPYANDPAYQEMRTVFLPMARAGEQLNAEIRLNGVKWKIPRGVPVEVPMPVYEQFMRVLNAEAAEIRLHNLMMGAMSPENYGMGFRLNEEPI